MADPRQHPLRVHVVATPPARSLPLQPADPIRLEARPRVRALVRTLARNRGGRDSAPDALAALRLELAPQRMHPERPNRFAAATGAPYDGRTLPPTFPVSLFVPLLARLLADDRWPGGSAGWRAHALSFEQHGTLQTHERCGLSVEVRSGERRASGLAVTLSLRLQVDDAPRWTGRVQLARGDFGGPTGGSTLADDPAAPILTASAGSGRAWAWATGDCRPGHLSAVVAQLSGAAARAPSAWVLTRAHALLADRIPKGALVSADVCFPAPLQLGAHARVLAGPLDDATGSMPIEVRTPEAPGPHLVGALTLR